MILIARNLVLVSETWYNFCAQSISFSPVFDEICTARNKCEEYVHKLIRCLMYIHLSFIDVYVTFSVTKIWSAKE